MGLPSRLRRIRAGHKGLEKAFNTIIDAVNENMPIEGAGIRISRNSNGSIIEIAAQPTSPQSPGGASSSGSGAQPDLITPAGETAAWLEIYAVNPLDWTLNKLWVWSGQFRAPIVPWTQVTTVDPTTCAQQQIKVLTKPPGL